MSMNKIETAMIEAIREGNNFKSGNTEVRFDGSNFEVLLHGNKIAWGKDNGVVLYLDDCGWKTATTKSRLNAMIDGLPTNFTGTKIAARKGEWKIVGNGGEYMDWETPVNASLIGG